jgi:hypothetical protein
LIAQEMGEAVLIELDDGKIGTGKPYISW